MRPHSIELTDDQIVRVAEHLPEHEKVQAILESIQAQRNLRTKLGDDALGKVLAVAVEHAERAGELTPQWMYASKCAVCTKGAESIKFKSGPRKGQHKDWAYPYIFALDGSRYTQLGICRDCYAKEKVRITAALSTAKAEIRGFTEWKREILYVCTSCSLRQWDSERGLLPALMGGRYYGKCKGCAAESRFLGPMIFDRVKPEQWRLIPLSEWKQG